MFIPDPDIDFLSIPKPGSRGQKGTGSRIRIRNTASNNKTTYFPGMDVEETNPYFPLKEFITFNAPLKNDALINKLKEFNSQVAHLLSSQGVHHLQCSPQS
jgi:hypothetical protein